MWFTYSGDLRRRGGLGSDGKSAESSAGRYALGVNAQHLLKTIAPLRIIGQRASQEKPCPLVTWVVTHYLAQQIAGLVGLARPQGHNAGVKH